MNLYRISQNKNCGYDTYDSAVVAALSEEEARSIHPEGNEFWEGKNYTWCDPSHVKVELIGTTDKFEAGTVVIASFNAG